MKAKNWLITASILILAGLCICVTAYRILGFDFSGPTKKGKNAGSGSMIINTYEVKKDFRNIDIDADAENVIFVPAKDGKCTVVCVEFADEPHDVRVEGNTLKVDRAERKTGFHIGVMTEPESITVYLPDKKYQELDEAQLKADLYNLQRQMDKIPPEIVAMYTGKSANRERGLANEM